MPRLIALAAFVVAVVSIRAWGFIGISNDDASRALIAWDFARSPTLDPTRSSWLPAHTWTLGAILALWRDLDLAPRALSLASALACITLTARITRSLAASTLATVAALAITASWRWTLLPAASGAVPELPCAAWFLGAVALLQRGHFALAGACLSLSCGHRYEAWFAGAALVAYELLARRKGAWRLALTASVVPLAWLAINHARSGDALDFVHRVEAFRRAEGPLAPWSARLVRYPRLLVTELPLLVLFASLGVRAAWRSPLRTDALRLALASVLTLAMLTLGDLRGGGPTHHPARALVLCAWTLAPIAALGLTSLRSPLALAAAVACSLVLGAPRASELRDGVSRDAVCAGDAMRRLQSRQASPWLIEFARQDALWVEARSSSPERAVADRAFGASARSRGVTDRERAAAASSRELSETLLQKGFHATDRCGTWTVFTR